MARIWNQDEIKNLINTNDKMVWHSVKVLYDRQTESEQCMGDTHELNGVGYNGVDAGIMSSFAQFYERTGFLTPKQTELARKKLRKYSRQLVAIANGEM